MRFANITALEFVKKSFYIFSIVLLNININRRLGKFYINDATKEHFNYRSCNELRNDVILAFNFILLNPSADAI